MNIVGFETSTSVCSVGLWRDGQPIVEESLAESHIHSEKLLTITQHVLQAGDVAMDQLHAVAVSIGPGSFTGLRIGLSAAKGLCYALGIPMVAVPTLLAISEAVRVAIPGIRSVTVLLDARKEEWYAGEFRVSGNELHQEKPVSIRTSEHIMKDFASSPLIITDKPHAMRRLIGDGVRIEEAQPFCRGGIVAAIASVKAAAGEYVDAAEVEPFYLKDFVVRAAGAVSL